MEEQNKPAGPTGDPQGRSIDVSTSEVPTPPSAAPDTNGEDALDGVRLAASGSSPTYIHSYSNIDYYTCGQAAIATVLDYLGASINGLSRTVRDPNDSKLHWDSPTAVAKIKQNYGPDVLLGALGTSGGRIRDALRDHGFKNTDVMYAGIGTRWEDLWAALQTYVGQGGIAPVLVQADKIPNYTGFLNVSAHWPVVFRIDAAGVHLANCSGGTRVLSVDKFLDAWNYLAFNPLTYGYNHCAVLTYR